MDIWLIFHSFCQFINEVTHLSSLCELLDFRRNIENVGQENPSYIIQDISRIPLRREKRDEQGAGKILYTVLCTGLTESVLKPTQVDWASSLR